MKTLSIYKISTHFSSVFFLIGYIEEHKKAKIEGIDTVL